jgi:hypothetical protein
MRPAKVALGLLAGFLFLLLNWVMFTQGAEALTAANDALNWVGVIAIGIMAILDITLILYVLGKKFNWK